ncbi:conserved Plasmodium protein, unknown function [Plasmodium sp. gorilla clade G3]|nr:conserved Plasmodium protein, unknown function [Plasmodium sp. gorilla clade G3]
MKKLYHTNAVIFNSQKISGYFSMFKLDIIRLYSNTEKILPQEEKEKKKKKNFNYIPHYVLNENQKDNEKYNFEILMKNIKNKAEEYNLIKIKEIQNKILIHLNKFNINEIVATLILSYKYNLLNQHILTNIIDIIFHNSGFLNSKHVFILLLITKNIYLKNIDYFYSIQHEQKRQQNDMNKSGEKEEHVINNKWKNKFFNQVIQNMLFDDYINDYNKEEIKEDNINEYNMNNKNDNIYNIACIPFENEKKIYPHNIIKNGDFHKSNNYQTHEKSSYSNLQVGNKNISNMDDVINKKLNNQFNNNICQNVVYNDYYNIDTFNNLQNKQNEQDIYYKLNNKQDIYPQPHNKQDIYPQPHNKQDIYPQPHNKQDIYPQPHNKQDIYPQSHNKQDIYTQPHNKQDIYPQPHNKQDIYTQPHNKQDIYSQTHNKQDIYPQSHNKQDIYSQTHNKQDIYPQSHNKQDIYSLLNNEQDIILNDEISELKNSHEKIKEILLHNYNHILFNFINNIYTNLLLLNYMYDENIISYDEFFHIIYNINNEYNNDTFEKNDFKNYQPTSSYSINIIHSYIQDECYHIYSIYDIYINIHIKLLKNIFKQNNYIKNKYIFENIQSNNPIQDIIYTNKKNFIDTFDKFFQNILTAKQNIDYIKLFYLNICTHEIFKLIIISNDHITNVKIYYHILKKIPLSYITAQLHIKKGQASNQFYYQFLTILYYLQKKERIMKSNRGLFYEDLQTSSIEQMNHIYISYLNSLNDYTIHDLLIKSNMHNINPTHNINNVTTLTQTHNNMLSPNMSVIKNKPNQININYKDIYEQCNKQNVFYIDTHSYVFKYFIMDLTFNIINYLNYMDIYDKLFIFKYLIILNYKNEYIINIIHDHLYNFFILKLHYEDIQHIFYFLQYIFSSLIYSPTIFFFNIINNIEIGTFQKLLYILKKEKMFEEYTKKIYDHINIFINQNYKNVQKNKCKIKNSFYYYKKSIDHFQSVLYDFLFL